MKFSIVIIICFLTEMCFSQNFNWKKLTDEKLFVIDYLDSNNLDTVSNFIYFYIKEEYPDPEFHKRNLNHPDSIYTLYSSNIENPELSKHFTIQFYKDGTIKFTPNNYTFECNLMDYGFGNLIYAIYYNLVTGKNLLDCKK